MSEHFGSLAADMALLDGDSPPPTVPKSDGLPQSSSSDYGEQYWPASDLTPEQILSDDLRVYELVDGKMVPKFDDSDEVVSAEVTDEPRDVTDEETQEEPEQASLAATNDSLLSTEFWTARDAQGYEQASREEQITVTDSALRGVFTDKVMASLPQLKGLEESERQSFIDGRFREVCKAIHDDKAFLAKLDKIYDGSLESIERGGNLFIQRALNILPRLLSNFSPANKAPTTRALTQAEANGMDLVDILSSMRPVEKKGRWVPWQDLEAAR